MTQDGLGHHAAGLIVLALQIVTIMESVHFQKVRFGRKVTCYRELTMHFINADFKNLRSFNYANLFYRYFNYANFNCR